MKRFLSLVLSALFVFQLGNASCDAGSQWDKRKVICADIYGNSVQPQGLIVPYIPLTIQQPEIKPGFKMKVDATTTADKIWGWFKLALTLAFGCAVLKTILPFVTFFTGLPKPLVTMQGWGEGVLNWAKGIWKEDPNVEKNQNDEKIEQEYINFDYSGKSKSNESWWGARLWQKLTTTLMTFGMVRGSGFGKMP